MNTRRPSDRLQLLGKTALLILIAGLLYAVLIRTTEFAVPCMFRLITGFKCPGCGITTACLAVLRGDICAARNANPFLFFIAPVLSVILVRRCALWIVHGTVKESKTEDACVAALVFLTLVWGIIRNVIPI